MKGEKRVSQIFNLLAIILFSMLLLESFIRTGKNSADLSDEFIYFFNDSILNNLVKLGVFLLLFYMIFFSYMKWQDKVDCKDFLIVICFITAFVSIYWVEASNTAPHADQYKICTYAEAFNRGDFSGLQPGGYVASCSQQLGLITLMRIIFYIFGNGNYKAFQYFSSLMVPVIIYAGFMIVRILSNDKRAAELCYLVLMLFCIPLYAYVPFVYGEVCSTAFIMLAAWFFLECIENFTWGRLVLLTISTGIAVQLRQNTLIMVLSFLIVTIIKIIFYKSRSNFIFMGTGIIVGIFIVQTGIRGIYNDVVPIEGQTMPAILYVTMGTNDEEENPGWYNGYNFSTFKENNYDPDSAKRKAYEDLSAFGAKCIDNPEFAVDFLYRKIASQWNSPMYQCLAMNNNIVGKQSKLAASIYSGNLRPYIENFMNIYQLLVYGGVLILLIVYRNRWRRIEKYVILIGIFGGFLFSILWEAKTRYIFPYFIMMIPYTAIVLEELMEKLIVRNKYRR